MLLVALVAFVAYISSMTRRLSMNLTVLQEAELVMPTDK